MSQGESNERYRSRMEKKATAYRNRHITISIRPVCCQYCICSQWHHADREMTMRLKTKKCPLSSFKWLLFWHSMAALLLKTCSFFPEYKCHPNYFQQIWGVSLYHFPPNEYSFWLYSYFPVIQDRVRQSTEFRKLEFHILVNCAALLNSMKKKLKSKNKGWQVGRRMWRRAEVWLLFETRWMTGASLTCRQAPRCLLVSHCHLCQQTMSCIQPSALIYIH